MAQPRGLWGIWTIHAQARLKSFKGKPGSTYKLWGNGPYNAK